jgi:hypothetical protein
MLTLFDDGGSWNRKEKAALEIECDSEPDLASAIQFYLVLHAQQ